MSVWQAVLASLVLLLGSALQGSVGFGLSLVAAPLLVLIEPSFVPVPLILASFALNVLVIGREKGAHHWRPMRWPIIGSIPGSLLGAAVLAVFPTDGLTIFFGVLILLAVGLSVSGLHPRRTTASLTTAGVVSGFMGTAVGIGGPPLALLFQHAPGPELRASLSRYFAVGSVISMVMLAVFGQVHTSDLLPALVMIPGVLIGFAASGWLKRHVDGGRVRVAVLTISAVSAVIAIVRVFW
jgi:uncharacterized membrane protein YfcA